MSEGTPNSYQSFMKYQNIYQCGKDENKI